jgi:hypothetical protein
MKVEITGLDHQATGFNVGVNVGENAGQTVFHTTSILFLVIMVSLW